MTLQALDLGLPLPGDRENKELSWREGYASPQQGLGCFNVHIQEVRAASEQSSDQPYPSVLRTKKFSGLSVLKEGQSQAKPDGWSSGGQPVRRRPPTQSHLPLPPFIPHLHLLPRCLASVSTARPRLFSRPVFPGHHLWHVFLFYFLTVTYLYLAYLFHFFFLVSRDGEVGTKF